MRWLALDVGARRVGVAICDPGESVVSSLDPLGFEGPGALAAAVASLAGRWKADGVVVGLPLTRDGHSRGERRVSAVVEALRQVLEIRVETADERGTTAAAEALLAEAGVPRGRWPRLVDGVAARLILETFLASRPASDGRDE